jgi:hypothetical protein
MALVSPSFHPLFEPLPRGIELPLVREIQAQGVTETLLFSTA